jgi:hypothetical protein
MCKETKENKYEKIIKDKKKLWREKESALPTA